MEIPKYVFQKVRDEAYKDHVILEEYLEAQRQAEEASLLALEEGNESGQEEQAVAELVQPVQPVQPVRKRRNSINPRRRSIHRPTLGRQKRFGAIAKSVGKTVTNLKQKEDDEIDMEELKQCDPALLDQWYFLEKHDEYPKYKLHRITNNLKDFLSGNTEKRREAVSKYIDQSNKVLYTLQKYTVKVVKDSNALKEFNTSGIVKGFKDL